MIFIDAAWWCGGNRQRGIGRYLDAFFRQHFSVENSERIWIFPQWSSAKQQESLIRRYGGKVLVVPVTIDIGQLQDWWRSVVAEYQPEAVWIASPFERPWSVLDVQNVLFADQSYEVHAIIFDLLPIVFPKQILQQWPKEDQEQYQQRLEMIKQTHVSVISPYVSQQVQSLLGMPAKAIEVLEFGLKTDWLEVPSEAAKGSEVVVSQKPVAITISGGEWRKNLAGTLEFFAEHFGKTHQLVVICKLGWREQMAYRWRAFRLGILRSVQFVGEVNETTKWQYLFQAEIGLFLSRAEGLGIPLLEYSRAAIPQISISRELAENGFDELVPDFVEIV